jgi:hypothetical protein
MSRIASFSLGFSAKKILAEAFLENSSANI